MVRLRTFGVSTLLGASLVACGRSATGPAGLPTQACDDAARAAASAPPSSGQTQHLDAVLRACTSVPDLEAAGSKYPSVFAGGDTVKVATARCKEADGPGNVPVCLALLATPGPS
jgi:hypothetical protein